MPMPTGSCDDDDDALVAKAHGVALEHHFENLKAIFSFLQDENATLRESCLLLEKRYNHFGQPVAESKNRGPGATLAPSCPKPAVATSRSLAEASIFEGGSGLQPDADKTCVDYRPALSHSLDAQSKLTERYNGYAKPLEKKFISTTQSSNIFSLGTAVCTAVPIGATTCVETRSLASNADTINSPEDDFSQPSATPECQIAPLPLEVHHHNHKNLTPQNVVCQSSWRTLSERCAMNSRRNVSPSYSSHGDATPESNSPRSSERRSPTQRDSAFSDSTDQWPSTKTSRLNRREQSRLYRTCALKSSSMTDFRKYMHDSESQKCLPRVVATTGFEIFFFSVIISNIALLGFETNYRATHIGEEDPLGFIIAQFVYFLTFLVELLLRLCSLGPRAFCRGADSIWNMLDLAIVSFAAGEVLVTVETLVSGSRDGKSHAISTGKVLRLARGLRLLRALRIVRVVRFLGPLQTLCTSIYGTLKSFLWAIFLLLLIIYGFALLFTHASADHREDALNAGPTHGYNNNLGTYFGHIGSSMQTLFMSICNGVSWEVAYRSLHDINLVWAQGFNVFVAFTYFCVLNILTANFCQTAIEHAQSDQDSIVKNVIAQKDAYKRLLRGLYTQIDTNKSGILSLKEMTEHFQDEQVQAFFQSLDLDPPDAWTLFKLLDADGGENVDINEFVDGCMRLRGQARAIDLATMMTELNWLTVEMCDFMNTVEDKLARLHKSTSSAVVLGAEKYF